MIEIDRIVLERQGGSLSSHQCKAVFSRTASAIGVWNGASTLLYAWKATDQSYRNFQILQQREDATYVLPPKVPTPISISYQFMNGDSVVCIYVIDPLNSEPEPPDSTLILWRHLATIAGIYIPYSVLGKQQWQQITEQYTPDEVAIARIRLRTLDIPYAHCEVDLGTRSPTTVFA